MINLLNLDVSKGLTVLVQRVDGLYFHSVYEEGQRRSGPEKVTVDRAKEIIEAYPVDEFPNAGVLQGQKLIFDIGAYSFTWSVRTNLPKVVSTAINRAGKK